MSAAGQCARLPPCYALAVRALMMGLEPWQWVCLRQSPVGQEQSLDERCPDRFTNPNGSSNGRCAAQHLRVAFAGPNRLISMKSDAI